MMFKHTRRLRLLLLAGALAALAGTGAAPALHHAAPLSAAAATGPCGSMAGQPASIKHVVIIMDENQSYNAIMGGTAAPNIKNYANECGVATKYWAITHPSHSDYIATVAGNTYVPPGCSDWTCVSKPLDFCGGTTGTNGTQTCPNIFSQIDTAGKSWKVYGESMPSNCYASASGQYSAGHNPPVWFIQGTGSWNINASCKANDVPLESSTAGLQHDITNNSLPAYSWIVPNKCNDMHNCSSGSPVTAGDNFIKTWVDRIIATPDYQNGNTLVLITWDEGVEGGRPFNEDCLSGSGLTDESCHVPLIAISPYIQAGSKPGAFYTHYGLLKATERLLGINTFLGHAGDAGVGDILAGFGIQLGGGGGGGDTTPPDAPTGLAANSTGQTSIHLAWNAASDNVGVTNYQVLRDGNLLTTLGNVTSYDDTGLQPDTTYSYTVRAKDAAGNTSGDSNTASATTDPGTTTTVFSDDFETGNLSKWTSVKGLTVQSHDVFAGSFGAEDKTTGTAQSASATFGGHTDLTLELRFKVLSKSSTTIELAKLKNSGGQTVLDLLLTGSTNKLRIRNGVASTTLTAAQTAPTGAWHLLTAHVTIAGTSGQTQVTLDGTTAFTQTWNTGTTPLTQLILGDTTSGRTSDVVFDNVVAHT